MSHPTRLHIVTNAVGYLADVQKLHCVLVDKFLYNSTQFPVAQALAPTCLDFLRSRTGYNFVLSKSALTSAVEFMLPLISPM